MCRKSFDARGAANADEDRHENAAARSPFFYTPPWEPRTADRRLQGDPDTGRRGQPPSGTCPTRVEVESPCITLILSAAAQSDESPLWSARRFGMMAVKDVREIEDPSACFGPTDVDPIPPGCCRTTLR